MTKTTDHLIQHLAKHISVRDRRGEFRPHPTARYPRRDISDIVFITWHHTAGPTRDARAVERIWNYHRDTPLGSGTAREGAAYWAALVLEPTGPELHVMHDLEVATYSQGTKMEPGDENKIGLGIVVAGSFHSPAHPKGIVAETSVLQAVVDVSNAILEWLGATGWQTPEGRSRWPEHRITGHFDYGKAACPGIQIETIIRTLRGEQDLPERTIADYQRSLVQLGYDIGPAGVDGIWGPASAAALKQLESEAGLFPTGRITRASRGAITEALLRKRPALS